MAIYSRKNLVINTGGTNALFLTPPTNGSVLVFDASNGSFINASNIVVGAENLGTGSQIFETNNDGNLEFNSLIEGANVTLTEVAGGIVISAATTAGTTMIVADIAARDALVGIGAGQQVYVESDADGEGALYLWNGSVWVLLGTQDSAHTDAKTLTNTVNFNSPSSNSMGNVSPGGRVVLVTVNVLVPFNGVSPTLTVGDDDNGHDIHMEADLNDLTVSGKYVSEGTFIYSGSEDTLIKIYLSSGGSTVGQAQVSLTYA